MKRILFPLFCACLLCGCAALPENKSAARQIEIVKQGKSAYAIVLPEKCSWKNIEFFLRQGAQALQSAIKEGTGAELPVIRESKLKPGQKAIFIGECNATRAAGIDCRKFRNYDHLIAERNGNIFLAGFDAPGSPVFRKIRSYKRCYLGSVKAVVSFMEKFLGTKILYPGETGRTTPKRAVISVPERLNMEIHPLLIMGASRHHELIYDMSNNDFGFPQFFIYGGHSYYAAVPEKLYGKTHPEYFILKGGLRVSRLGHLCISNPEVQNLIYQEAKKQLQAGAAVVELGQTDGFQACECEKCKELYHVADFGEKLWILHREIAGKLYREMPEKKVLIISYGPTIMPPRTFKEFPPNTMIELCRYNQPILDAWSKIKVPQGFTSYIYNWGSYKLPGYTPTHAPEYPAAQVKTFNEFGIKGIYRCGFGSSFGLEGPIYYMYGKLWDDPSQDYKKLLVDFYQAAFGESAVPMQQFYTLLFERLRPFAQLDRHSAPNIIGKLCHQPTAYLASVYTPELLNAMEQHLSRAERKASDAKVRKRLALVRAEFEYARNLARIIYFYYAYKFAPDRNGFEKVAAEVEKRNAMIDSYFDAKGRRKSFPGWPELLIRDKGESRFGLKSNGRLEAPIGAPLNWDIPQLRKLGILPGTQVRKCKVFRRRAGALEDFRTGAWKSIPFQTLGGVQLEQIKRPTRFKLMYDDKNLYAAFEAVLPESRTYTAHGRDGGATADDCLEFLVDPFGQREIYYHLLWNPVAGSFYDSAKGLISDPLHPNFGTYDPTWNGNWSYRSFREGDRWYTLLTIPCKTIGAAKPEPGSKWLLNVGRTDYGSRANRAATQELSLWSPNPESRSFHDPECFGIAEFE